MPVSKPHFTGASTTAVCLVTVRRRRSDERSRYRTLALFVGLLRMRYNLNRSAKVVSSRSFASRVPHGPVLVLSWRSGLRDPRAHLRRSALDPGGLDTYDGHRRTPVAVPVPVPALRARWPRHPPTHGVAAATCLTARAVTTACMSEPANSHRKSLLAGSSSSCLCEEGPCRPPSGSFA